MSGVPSDWFHAIECLTRGAGSTAVTALAGMEFDGAFHLATRMPAGVKVVRRGIDQPYWRAVYPTVRGEVASILAEPARSPFLPGLTFAIAAGNRPRLFTNAFHDHGVALAWSDTGECFLPVAEFPGGYGPVTALLGCQGRLFVAVAGDAASGRAPALLWNEGPAWERWRPMVESPFGDSAHVMITHLIAWQGRLYAAVANDERGFQLWWAGLTPEGMAEDWHCVLRDGAERHTGNREILALTVWNDELCLAAGRTGQTAANARPLGVDLLRVDQDDRWEILAGAVRFTPQGLKVPLASLGSGLGDPARANLLGLFSHRGTLYIAAGTLPEAGEPIRQQLWASSDGEQFEPREWPGLLVEAAQPLLGLIHLGDHLLACTGTTARFSAADPDIAEPGAAISTAAGPGTDSLPPGLTVWRLSL